MKIKIIKMCGLVWVGCESLWVKNGLEGKADVAMMWLWVDVGWYGLDADSLSGGLL